jgi:hypothetical protein
VQKERGSYEKSCRARIKQSYGLDKRQEAVKALERGENLTKVSHEFQVMKDTFFCSELEDKRKQAKLQGLRDSSEINGDNLSNIRREASRHSRN